MMKKLMCALMALLLTIGLCNLNVVNIKAISEEAEEKGDENKNSNYQVIDDTSISAGFGNELKRSPINVSSKNPLKEKNNTFGSAMRLTQDQPYSTTLYSEFQYYYFDPRKLQSCELYLISPFLGEFVLVIYDANKQELFRDEYLLSHSEYIQDYKPIGGYLVGYSFTIKTPVYILLYPLRGGVTSDYKIGLFTYPPFEDVKDDAWYFQTIKETYDKGLMTGTSETKFQPDAKMTRGMVATVLYRMAGAPNVAYAKKFSDVKKSDYFSIAVTWASNKKVINGYGNGKFGANDNITREQMAAMCYNYAKFRTGKTPTATTSLTRFSDYKNVTKNMEIPMKWAVAAGLISGSNGKLNPTGKATRAECAKMLLQLSKIVK